MYIVRTVCVHVALDCGCVHVHAAASSLHSASDDLWPYKNKPRGVWHTIFPLKHEYTYYRGSR